MLDGGSRVAGGRSQLAGRGPRMARRTSQSVEHTSLIADHGPHVAHRTSQIAGRGEGGRSLGDNEVVSENPATIDRVLDLLREAAQHEAHLEQLAQLPHQLPTAELDPLVETRP